MNFKLYISFLLIALINKYYAQNTTFNFIPPLDRALVITGNYGELRPNHFHAGIDFSTDPVANLPIKAVGDGYVSRIKISSGGYGKALYITHYNGYVTVYAHQKKYADKIDEYIKSKQIEQQKNEIEIFPPEKLLTVKKGEIIGYTGNTGSSTGPHLHFEIREEKSEIPINPLLVYKIKDATKPELTHVAIYNTVDTNQIQYQMSFPVKNTNNKSTSVQNTLILKQNTFAIGFSGFDKADGSNNKNNIYEAKVFLDDELIYHHQLNTISFDQARYINVFSEKINGIKFQKCFALTCYDVTIYKKLKNGGKIALNDTLQHKIEILIADENLNTNKYSFFVKTNQIKGYIKPSIKHNVICNKETIIKKDDIEVIFKAGTFSRNCFVAAYLNKLGKAVIGSKDEALLKACTISIKIPKVITGKENKMVLMNENNCIGGIYNNGWLNAESKTLGTFYATYDTITPSIQIHPSKNHSLSKTRVVFKINDNLSGIADYHVFVNNVWQIAEYDAKTKTVTCVFTEKDPKTLKIEVIDKVGNKAVLNKEF